MSQTIGFLGLGKMGQPMCEQLLKAGFQTFVVDPSDEAAGRLERQGAVRLRTPKALADHAAIAVMMLPTPEIVEETVLGVDGLVHGARLVCAIDMGTSGSALAVRIGEVLHRNGKRFVDAPVTGAIKGAQTGTLTIMASGMPEDIDFASTALAALGKMHRVGSQPGMGQTMKLINNLASAANMAVTTEVMVLGRKAGLDCQQMLDIMNAGSGRNSASEDKFPDAIMPRTFNFGFPMDLQIKDLKLCMDEALRLRVPMHVGSSVFQLWFHWLTQGSDKRDFTTIVEMIETWSGVKIESSAQK
ncbi:NAD(P)-dependent oxidoreductase [Mesorhizobium sp. CA8]|uniref:NAD(P)-dependent oxidoreductase n=1 Tax=unclassified Mesorhizobium TaxID=325217 RepID=UPI001CCAA857|nr:MULTISPECIES: NAD(P)-dependent oxidoreductase [unclassified Mesorhizobium]MBZ9761714.1 NAD(P)-dependent oxidoreductase [Mesorhizobium sp. CA8]MBZ9820532.1 NAD(P)-dependent oxidoreductase [Mesorhizobium sp. CA4]